MPENNFDPKSIDQRLTTVEGRLMALEEWRRRKDIDFARDDERGKFLIDRFDRIDREISDMKNGVRKLVWIVGSAVVVAVMNFILQGGLTVLIK